MKTISNDPSNRSNDLKFKSKNKKQKKFRKTSISLYNKKYYIKENFLKSRYPPVFIAFILYLIHYSIPKKDVLLIANNIRERLPKKYSTISKNLARKTLHEWDKNYWKKIKKVISSEEAFMYIELNYPKILKTIYKKYYDKIGYDVPNIIFFEEYFKKYRRTLNKLIMEEKKRKSNDIKIEFYIKIYNVQITSKISNGNLDFKKIYEIANKNKKLKIIESIDPPDSIQVTYGKSNIIIRRNGKCAFSGKGNVEYAKNNFNKIISIIKEKIPNFNDNYKLQINNISSTAKFAPKLNLNDIKNSIYLFNYEYLFKYDNDLLEKDYKFEFIPISKKEKKNKSISEEKEDVKNKKKQIKNKKY